MGRYCTRVSCSQATHSMAYVYTQPYVSYCLKKEVFNSPSGRNIMRLSMSCPTTPNTGRGGGQCTCCFTTPLGWGSDWHANLLHIPHLAPTGVQSKQKTLCYMTAFCLFTEKYERVKCPTPRAANSWQIPT